MKFCTGAVPVYRVRAGGTQAALFLLHVGGPAAASFVENLIPWGGRYFVFSGSCGVLRRDIAAGHLIMPTAAVRDEGLSYHYLPPAEEIVLDPGCVAACRKALERLGLPLRGGQDLDHQRLLPGDPGEGAAPEGAGLPVRGDGVRLPGGGGPVPGGALRPVFLVRRQPGRPGVGRQGPEPPRGLCFGTMLCRRLGDRQGAAGTLWEELTGHGENRHFLRPHQRHSQAGGNAPDGRPGDRPGAGGGGPGDLPEQPDRPGGRGGPGAGFLRHGHLLHPLLLQLRQGPGRKAPGPAHPGGRPVPGGQAAAGDPGIPGPVGQPGGAGEPDPGHGGGGGPAGGAGGSLRGGPGHGGVRRPQGPQ